MPFDIGDKPSVLFQGLSGFWQRFFKDAADIEAYYQAAEVYLGQLYLDLLGSILNVGIIDTPVFNKEYWKLFTILETEIDFMGGAIPADDRYIYDMPDASATTDFLQNTILEPAVIFERDVDFDIEDNDGLIRFHSDPFNAYQDSNGTWMPTPGIAWRTVRMAVGNAMYDTGLFLYSPTVFSRGTAYDLDWRRGDTLRILAYRGSLLEEGLNGSIKHFPTGSIFYGTNIGLCKVGDVIQVYNHSGGAGHADDVWKGFYIVKNVTSGLPNQVDLEPLTVPSTSFDSTTNLYWKQYRAIYFEVGAPRVLDSEGEYKTVITAFRDYELDYFEGMKGIGSPANPYPLDLNGPVIYSVVRDSPDPTVSGISITFVGLPGGPLPPPPLPAPVVTDLGQRHLIPGSVVIRAYRYQTENGNKVPVREGTDYTIDYLRGLVYQTKYWDDQSLGKCDYEYQTEVYLSGAGTLEEYIVGNVRQLSFWVPEVLVDRFNLWYNYGSLLNRFDASSDAYKAFLRGIMYLYMTGPILERIEAALNVAAEYPVIVRDGELLLNYDNGENGSGTGASIDGTFDTVTLPTSEYVLSDLDVGGYIIFPSPLNAANKNRFRMLSINTITNTATLETTYGMVTETPVDWIISHTYTKTVTTDRATYSFPYYVPIREDVMNSSNFNLLTFEAFEPLTVGFTVTDYLEDPTWWHNKIIPPTIWENEPTTRRTVSNILYEHIIGADDDSHIGDPGLYIGADEYGNVFMPTVPGTSDRVSLYRHNVAFFIFDQYLKMHMYYIEIDADLELDDDFKTDLEELVLVAKPSYTYTIVEPNEAFIDDVIITDIFSIPEIGLHFGGDEDNKLDSLHLANNELVIGDANFPWYIGDFYRYKNGLVETTAASYSNPVPVGTIFIVPNIPSGASLLNLVIDGTRTSDGDTMLEGRDYTVNWLAENPPGTPNPSAWQVEILSEYNQPGGGPTDPISCTVWYAERLNGPYDTTLGWTPIHIGGLNPWYIRMGALDPSSPTFAAEWEALRTEYIDRPIQLTIVDGGGSYTYP